MAILPTEKNFFNLYEEQAQILFEITQILHGLKDNYSDLPAAAGKIKNLEKKADLIVHQVVKALEHEQIKVTEIIADIRNFVHNLDDIIDFLEDAVFNLYAYRLPGLPEIVLEFFSVLEEAAREIRNGACFLRRLQKNQKELQICVKNLNILEEKADDIHRNWRKEIMNTDLSDREVMKLREIVGALENAMDSCKHVGNYLEMFCLKGEI